MLDAYLNFLTEDPESLVSLLFLTLARILPIISLAPFLGAKLMPQPAKVALGLALFAILLPYISRTISTPLQWNGTLIAYLLKELAVGFIMGFLISMPFNVAQMSGILIDNQRGSSSLTGSDPISSNQVSTIGILYNFLMVVIFFSINGPFLFFDALLKSYHVIAIDQFPSISFFATPPDFFWKYIIGIAARVFAISTQLAAPPVVAILMADVFLGIVNRLAPQVQISFLGMGLKAYSGDIALWAAWFFILERLGKMSLDWIQELNQLLDHMPT